MTKKLIQLLLKALYAGYKYHLAARHMTDNYEQGRHDSSSNQTLLANYFRQWREHTLEAVALHTKEQGDTMQVDDNGPDDKPEE